MAWQLAKAMKKKKLSKARMAVLLKTSRAQVDRILDPKRDIMLSSLRRAAALVGQRVVIEFNPGRSHRGLSSADNRDILASSTTAHPFTLCFKKMDFAGFFGL